MAYSEAIEVYKNVLERDENFPAHFFTFGTQKQKITEIIRYLLLDKLNITSYEEAQRVMRGDFMHKYKLEQICELMPVAEMLPDECYHLAWIVFPESKMTNDELTLKVYKDILAGRRAKFPSKYFVKAIDPEHKASLCFKYLCEEVLHLKSDTEILKIFGRSSGIKVLTQYKLKIVLNTVYPSLSHLLVGTYPNIFANGGWEDGI